jgi:ParB family transcriptional regulator, chromosome partitioning protein
MTDTITTLPLKSITLNGHNPRGAIDTKGDSFLELKASIEKQGILQPVLVGPADEKGSHALIAGERRFMAAKALKLGEIPVFVRDLDGQEALAALVENVQREDLSPVEEANALDRMRKDFGMTQVEAAKALGKSERWARERLRLVELPEKTKEAFDSGAIPLEAAVHVQKVAEKAPEALEAIAKDANTGEDTRGLDLAKPEDLAKAIDEAIEADDFDGCMVKPDHIGIADLTGTGIPDKILDDFKKRFKKLVETYPYFHSGTISFDDPDIDAARAFGCLLELEGRNRWGEKEVHRYITDPEWLADRLDEVLAAEIKDAEKSRKSYDKMTRSSSSSKAAKDDSPEAKEKRRKERQQELQERVVKHEVNLELGRRSADVYGKPKLTLEEAKLLALMVVGPYCEEAANSGLTYCDPEFQEVEEKKNGTVKVTYGVTGKSAGAAVLKAIKEATKPEEALGVALRVILLSHTVDREVVAESNMVVWRHRPGGPYHYGTSLGLTELQRTIAADRGLVTDEIRKDLERQARAQLLGPQVEILAAIAKCRAKAGLSIEGDPILGDEARELELEVVSHALAKRHIKEHAGDEGDTYTITGAGKKRLEKARAELKELMA